MGWEVWGLEAWGLGFRVRLLRSWQRTRSLCVSRANDEQRHQPHTHQGHGAPPPPPLPPLPPSKLSRLGSSASRPAGSQSSTVRLEISSGV